MLIIAPCFQVFYCCSLPFMTAASQRLTIKQKIFFQLIFYLELADSTQIYTLNLFRDSYVWCLGSWLAKSAPYLFALEAGQPGTGT